MLLRLLPLPTKETPAPPTVLFTLPAPVSLPNSSPEDPYGPHALPAPPSLVAHAQTCIYNDLPCQTLLSGESSSWINTVVKEVTFLPSIGEIQILLVDGSGVVMPLAEDEAGRMLHKVRDHVVASGRVAAAGERRPEPLPLMKRDSVSMLKSFLGTLIVGKAPSSAESLLDRVSVAGREPTARQHRRLARATLVDCYRRWVLAGIKDLLPPSYVLFSSHSILNLETKKLAATEAEIKVLLSIAGFASPPSSPALAASDKFASTSRALPSACELTPPASPHPPTCRLPSPPPAGPSSSADFPPTSAVPVHLRSTYSKHLSDLIDSQARIANVERLVRRHEREERRARFELYGERETAPASPRMSRTGKRSPKLGRPSALGRGEVRHHSPLIWGWTAEDVEVEHDVAMVFAPPPLSPTESTWSTDDSSSSASSENGEDDHVGIASPSASERDYDELLGSYAYSAADAVGDKSPQNAGVPHDATGAATLFGLGIAFSVTQAN